MSAILGTLPILLAVVFMVVLKKSAGLSMFCAWVLGIVLAATFWGLAPATSAAYTLLGFLSALDVLFIVFSAILLLNVLLRLRFIETIGNGFSGISQDRRVQIIIIAFFFSAFIEGAAGFGTAAALAAPLLVGLGIPPFFAALSSLIGTSASSVFGAAGTPTTVGYATIAPDIYHRFGIPPEVYFAALNTQTAFINIFVATCVPFLTIAFVVMRDGKKRGIKDALNILPLCLFSGLLFAVPGWLSSMLSPALPTLTGALVGLPVIILAVKKGFLVPKEVYRFKDDPIKEKVSESTGISLIQAWTPYGLIALVLVISRLPWLPVVDIIRHPAVTVGIRSILGFEGIDWTWMPLNNPGIFPFLPIAVIYLFLGKLTPEVPQLIEKTAKQLKNAALALMFGIALVQIMRFTNYTEPLANEPMTTEIARALVFVFGDVYLLAAPFIGILGSFVAGSTTVSNIMFYGLQLETAYLLGLPTIMILVGQNLGATVGNAIAINNVVAVAATTNAKGKENELIVGAVIPVLISTLIIVTALFIAGLSGMIWIA